MKFRKINIAALFICLGLFQISSSSNLNALDQLREGKESIHENMHTGLRIVPKKEREESSQKPSHHREESPNTVKPKKLRADHVKPKKLRVDTVKPKKLRADTVKPKKLRADKTKSKVPRKDDKPKHHREE